MTSPFTLPLPLRFFAYFPLHTYPSIPTWTTRSRDDSDSVTLWIHPPLNPSSSLLSSEIECLKWQAYLALRGLSNISVRWDIAADGGLEGRLPNIYIPSNEGSKLIASHMIPGWVDERLPSDPMEGYKDEKTKNESNAWISLLEDTVHAALAIFQPEPSLLTTLLFPTAPVPSRGIETLLTPPPPPLTGITSFFPTFGKHIDVSVVEREYKVAVASLSERLGTDKWFLDSPQPTALDALLFAYLHSILHSQNTIRFEVARHVNLVSWERRVESQVRAAFCTSRT